MKEDILYYKNLSEEKGYFGNQLFDLYFILGLFGIFAVSGYAYIMNDLLLSKIVAYMFLGWIIGIFALFIYAVSFLVFLFYKLMIYNK